jgi:hypothetical protein
MSTEIRYYAKRDSAKQGLGDYDRAMCHADIYSGDSFEARPGRAGRLHRGRGPVRHGQPLQVHPGVQPAPRR